MIRHRESGSRGFRGANNTQLRPSSSLRQLYNQSPTQIRRRNGDSQRIRDNYTPVDHSSTEMIPSNSTTPDAQIKFGSDIIYKALGMNQFRILLLESGLHKTRICCSIVNENIDCLYQYTALSYTWSSVLHVFDDPNVDLGEVEIELNGKSVWIKMNLAVALMYLRFPDRQRCLWVDAICINQADSIEKSQQLLLMKKIYQRAEFVFSWLGWEFNGSTHILDLVSAVAQQKNSKERRKLVLKALMDQRYNFRQACDSIFRRSYWYRAWIIQEVYFANKLFVACGKSIVSWDSLMDFLSFLDSEHHKNRHHTLSTKGCIPSVELKSILSGTNRVKDLGKFRELRYKSIDCKQRRTLDKLLFDNWDAEASDPRDKVFSIIELASDRDVYKIIPDYTQSVNAVYTNVVETFIRHTGDLSIIIARRWQNPQNLLPTYCPDWSSTTPNAKLGWHDAYPFEVKKRNKRYCAAGSNSKANVRFSVPGRIMNVTGWKLDSLQCISTNEKLSRQDKTSLSVIHRLWNRILDILDLEKIRKQEVLIHFEKWYAMHRRALNSDISARYGSQRSQKNERNLFRKLCRRKHKDFFSIIYRATTSLTEDHWDKEATKAASKWDSNEDIPDFYDNPVRQVLTPPLREALSEMGQKIMIDENYACFFMTSLGFMGLGPLDIREDDLICILRGCNFPIVLRLQDTGFFSIVGACYVQGFMYGEFFHHPQLRTTAEKEFRIC